VADGEPGRGRVTAIQRVDTRYRSDSADPTASRPVPGSSVLEHVETADGQDGDAAGRHLDGYVVELVQYVRREHAGRGVASR
jgi:hypothetical protein